jgi:flagellar P-ring protein FlgI
MLRCISTAMLLFCCLAQAGAQARIAEIAEIEGVRENIVRGIGLVMGLNKTGDKAQASKRMVESVLSRNQINVEPSELGLGNYAMVLVTAKIDPFRRPGTKIDVTVSSMMDAGSLFGGVLLQTHLVGFDNETVYAIAEGSLAASGIGAEGGSGTSVTINHPTVATIPNGALIEKEIPMQITSSRGVVCFNLRNQDWVTAHNLETVVNKLYPGAARAVTAATIEVYVPEEMKSRLTHFIATIQDLVVDVHMVSKVVINARTGEIAAGKDVKISTVAVTYGKLNVTITEAPEPALANPFTNGPGVVSIPRTDVAITEEQRGLQVVPGGETVAKLAQSLNALGATPRQLIGIFETIKAAGALQAELVIK